MRHELLAARKSAGKTQDEVATAAGIDRSYYVHIEKGNRSPSLQVAMRIAECLRKEVGEIFFTNHGVKKSRTSA